MTDVERRQIGNMGRRDMHEPNEFESLHGETVVLPSLAKDWASQGITYEITDPVATDTYTSEQLKAFGMVGVTLIIPKPE
jgi:hypothetical protein